MAFYYEDFTITGTVNTLKADSGLESTETETKHVKGIYLNVSGYQGNTAKVLLDREEIVRIPDYLLDTDSNTGGTSTLYSTEKRCWIPLEHTIEVGSTLKAAIDCGGNATDLRGAYCYEIR